MQQESIVLMASGGANLALRKVLRDAGINVCAIRSCAEARRVLENRNVPAVLFSEAVLPDGSWADVLALAAEGERQVPVVVVSGVVDMNLHINPLGKESLGFIASPFSPRNISQVLKCATQENVAVQIPGSA